MKGVRVIIFAGLAMAGVVWADTVVTRGGRTLEGRIELAPGVLKIGGATVALAEVRRARFAGEFKPPAPEPEDELAKLTQELWALRRPGVLCWNGTFLARAVAGMDDTKLTFKDAPAGVFVSTVNTAAVILGRMSFAQAMALRGKRAGVLLATGEFVEGQPRSLANGAVVVDSVLFGRKSYAVGMEVVAVWLRAPQVAAGDFTVRTRDGSELLVKAPVFKGGAVVLAEGVFKDFQIPRTELLEVRRGEAADVLSAAWAKVEAAEPAERARLLTDLADVGRTMQLDNLVKVKAAELRAATLLLEQANAERAAVMTLRVKVRQEGTRMRLAWRQRTQEYTRAKADAQRLELQAETSRRNMERLQKEVDGARREIENQDSKRKDFDKKMARAKNNEKLLGRYRGQHAEAGRALDRTRKALARAEQKLAAGKRDYEARLAKTKPLFEREAAARKKADEAKRANNAAQKEVGKARSAYMKVLRKPVAMRRRVAELKREHDAAMAEMERLLPRIPEIDLPEPR